MGALTHERARRAAHAGVAPQRFQHHVDRGEQILCVGHGGVSLAYLVRERLSKADQRRPVHLACIPNGAVILGPADEMRPPLGVRGHRAVMSVAVTLAQRLFACPGHLLSEAEVQMT